MTSGVYCIKNTVTGKRYIGSSKDIRYRLRKHRAVLRRGDHHSDHLQRSWNKHGPKAFEFRIIAHYDRCDLEAAEQFWIDWFESWKREKGYNIRQHVSMLLPPSAETRAKMSAAKKGYKPTDAARINMSLAQRGRVATPETRRKVSLARLNDSPAMHRKRADARMAKGWKHTDDSRKKMSESQKRRVITPEAKREAARKISASHKALQRHGEKAPAHKLTESQVREVVQLRASGMLMDDVASKVGCTMSNISAIERGLSWTHVTGGAFAKPLRKLSYEQARDIRQRFAAGGVTKAALAREYGLAFKSMCQLIAGLTYKEKAA